MTSILYLSGGSLEQSLAQALERGAEVAKQCGVLSPDLELLEPAKTMGARYISEWVAPRLSLVLYLCSLNADIRHSNNPNQKPGNPKPVKTKRGFKLFPADAPLSWDVGFRIGAALRRAQAQERTSEAGTAHVSPRAHIRRAHWHSYWTGPRDSMSQKLVLKWLPPIPVNIEGGLVPAIRDVSSGE